VIGCGGFGRQSDRQYPGRRGARDRWEQGSCSPRWRQCRRPSQRERSPGASTSTVSEDKQTRLTSAQRVESGRPPARAARLAGFWPRPAERALPRNRESSERSIERPAGRPTGRRLISTSGKALAGCASRVHIIAAVMRRSRRGALPPLTPRPTNPLLLPEPKHNPRQFLSAGPAGKPQSRNPDSQSQRNRDWKSAFLGSRSHPKKTVKEKARTGGKKRGKVCKSEVKKVGDRERGRSEERTAIAAGLSPLTNTHWSPHKRIGPFGRISWIRLSEFSYTNSCSR
jgi:hypothetical protein